MRTLESPTEINLIVNAESTILKNSSTIRKTQKIYIIK